MLFRLVAVVSARWPRLWPGMPRGRRSTALIAVQRQLAMIGGLPSLWTQDVSSE